MFSWFEQLRLRTKLVFGFGTVIALMLVGSAVAMVGHQRTLNAVEDFLAGDLVIADLSRASSAAMGEARRFEKEFLLKRQRFSFSEAKSRYATLVSNQLDSVRENMATIRRISVDEQIKAQTREIESITHVYEKGFLQTVDLYGKLGRVDTGLEGKFRRSAHAIEVLLANKASAPLLARLLVMRRHEKDFIMRNVSRYATQFDAAADAFRDDVRAAALPAAVKQQLLALADQYADEFHAYTATIAQIDATALNYLVAVHAIEPRLAQLHVKALGAADSTRETMRGVGRISALAIIAAGIAATLLGIVVASFIVRSASGSIRACVQFARSLASGDWAARMRAAAGLNEFAVLATALNDMADEMQEAHGREAQHAAALMRLNRTLRMLARCSETQLEATHEAELLHAVCQQIVEVGGYPVAWVALSRDDAGDQLELAASALMVGDKLSHHEPSWDQDVLQRSVPSAAMRERAMVLLRNLALPSEYTRQGGVMAGQESASCIALPLRSKEQLFGALCIYSAESDAFNSDEVLLLQELTDDLASGVTSLRDAIRREEAERALSHQASHDAVTGLANRVLFCDRLHQATLNAARNGHLAAVMVLGLDRFKFMTESLGHDAGNALLRYAGECIKGALRDSDIMARLSDDSFAVAIADLKSAEDAMPVALKLLAAVMQPLALADGPFGNDASIGISVFPRDGNDVNQLLRNATAAMASAQTRGGKQCRFYAPDMNERIGLMFAMETALRHAIEHGELRVYYQPRVNLASGEIVGAEALVRWQHPERGMVPPSEFIALAEDTGLILPLGEWVIKEVCRQQNAWRGDGLAVPAVAVNLSALQFRQKNLVGMIRHELEANQLDGKYLEIEITESALMDNLDEAVSILRSVKSMGIKVSLDDFGTGHSSLSRLRDLPIDHLKIDQSFVRNLTTDPGDAAICITIVDLAHNLRMTVIAEGVETEGQARFLRGHHCDDIQGYFFSRPVPAAEYARLVGQQIVLDLPARQADERRRLLLVDDEPNVLSALQRLLRREGYDVLTANSAREGLELLAIYPVQVILSDQRMPEMSGTEFLSRVRDLYPDTIRLVLSGYTDLSTVTEAINRGSIYRFLTKPWDDEALREHLREAFRHFEAAEQKLAIV